MVRVRLKMASTVVTGLALLGAQQERGDVRTRQLWDTNLQNRRPPGKSSHPQRQVASNLDESRDAYVGITLWRLRPSKSDDEPAARILVHPNATNRDEDWTPERCEVDAPLSQGQMVRLSIEAAREGYLYVVDREQYADGTFGAAQLVFPTLRLRHGRNHITPGQVVEIPSFDDSPHFLLVSRNRPDQAAEVLTVVVAPEPLRDLRIGRDPLKISDDQLTMWERKWGAAVKKLEAAGQAGRPYTKAEADAGKNIRMLNSDDPLPQTMYYVKARPGDPLLVTVPLKIQ